MSSPAGIGQSYRERAGTMRNRRRPSMRYVSKSEWSTVRTVASPSRRARWTRVASGEVHRAVPITRHQRVQIRQLGIGNRRHLHRAGADQSPRGLHVVPPASHEVKQFRQHRGRCEQRKPQLLKRFDARLMPSIGSVQKTEERAGIDEAVSGHVSTPGPPEPVRAPTPTGADRSP